MLKTGTSTLIFRFIVVGTLNFLVISLLVWLLMHVFSVDYRIANIVGYVVAQVHNFLWCKYWIFPVMEGGGTEFNLWQQISLFLFAFGCAFISQFLLTVTLVELFGFNEYVGQFIGILLYGAVNFTMNRKLTFK